MPKKYEAMRDKFMKKGMKEDKAKEKAAKIYNATKKKGEKAVSGKMKDEKKPMKKGIVIRIGKQPPMGFTRCFLKSSIVSV